MAMALGPHQVHDHDHYHGGGWTKWIRVLVPHQTTMTALNMGKLNVTHFDIHSLSLGVNPGVAHEIMVIYDVEKFVFDQLTSAENKVLLVVPVRAVTGNLDGVLYRPSARWHISTPFLSMCVRVQMK